MASIGPDSCYEAMGGNPLPDFNEKRAENAEDQNNDVPGRELIIARCGELMEKAIRDGHPFATQGIPAETIMSYREGDELMEAVEARDAALGDMRGYFREVVTGLAASGLPVGITANTERKGHNDDCMVAEALRSVPPELAANGKHTELKTAGVLWQPKRIEQPNGDGKSTWIKPPRRLAMAHYQVGQHVDTRKVAAELGVSKSAMKGFARRGDLDALGLDNLGNGLFNPFTCVAQQGGEGAVSHHLMCPGINEPNSVWTTNAGSRDMGLVMVPATFEALAKGEGEGVKNHMFTEITKS